MAIDVVFGRIFAAFWDNEGSTSRHSARNTDLQTRKADQRARKENHDGESRKWHPQALNLFSTIARGFICLEYVQEIALINITYFHP